MTAQARRLWREKLDYLLAQEAVLASPAQRFELQQQIAECRAKLAELDEEDQRRREPAGSSVDLSTLPVGVEHFLGGQPELAALLEAAKEKGLLVLAVPVLATGTTGALTGAGADATPLPDAVRVDALSQCGRP